VIISLRACCKGDRVQCISNLTDHWSLITVLSKLNYQKQRTHTAIGANLLDFVSTLMEQIPSWQAVSSSAILEIPLLYGTQKLSAVFTATGRLSLPVAKRTQSTKFYFSKIRSIVRDQLKCDGTRAETRFVFRWNGRVHLNRPRGVSSVDYWQPRCAHQR
jgi:hypothetical protein